MRSYLAGLLVFGMTTGTIPRVAAVAVITDAARVTTTPALPDREIRKLADGSPRTGIAFPVGSAGEGAVILRFPHPHAVSGLRFYQHSAVYVSTKCRVRGDTDGDGTFEKILAVAACKPAYKWTALDWPETVVHGLRFESVEGVSKGKRAHPAIAELEVFGKPLPTDVDDARAAGWPVRRISAARPLERWIDLSGVVRPVVILAPDDPASRAAAAVIEQALKKKGATRVTRTADPAAALPAAANVIALGNMNDNELIARLYWNGYACEDARLPGPGGWSLRTVYDPYPWHGKGDVVVAGCSRAAAAGKAAAALVAAIEVRAGRVGLGYRLEVSTAPKLSEASKRRLEKNNAPNFKVFLNSARSYQRTGREAYARHAVATLERIVAEQAAKPDWFYDWPEETSSSAIMAAWDAFEECPLIPENQRLAFTNAFLRFLRLLPRHISGYGNLGKGDLVTWNHTTFPLLGLYFGARYFHDYYALEDTTEYLAKAKACFLAQARSWKPQEDADSYLILTENHALDYCLAEWRVDLLKQTGIIPKFADYVVGICDNAGLAAGFGDSGLSRAPTLIRNVLPRAFWWTRDPGYLWILRHTQGKDWETPFHPEIQPVEPRRFLGLKAYPLDAGLYAYTEKNSFYTERFMRPNVPAAQAFDKIAFRASWDKNGQYFLLDGFSRGKHLHFDGNAIIEYVDRGRRWLIDHDYLTRNTTEHNMLSIIRNGRANQLEPPCAALLCQADPGGAVALAATEVRDWLGIDWQRNLFWRKGGPLVVLDRATARSAADYDLDLVWKVERRGDERLEQTPAGGVFTVRRSEAGGRTRGVFPIDDPRASGGKAVILSTSDAELSFLADLPAGNLRVGVIGYGNNTGADSVFVSIGGAPAAPCGLPLDRYGSSREKPNFTGRPTTPIISEHSGRQVVSVCLREHPPIHLDRLVFYDEKGRELCAVEAENAPRPTRADIERLPADRFFIKYCDAPATRTVASHPKGIVVPVLKCIQRRSGPLEAGQTAEFANLLYTAGPAAPAAWTLRRLAPGAVLLDNKATPAVLAVRGAVLPGLRTDAGLLWIGPDRVTWCDARAIAFAGCRITAAEICSGEIEAATGRVSGGADVTVTGLTPGAVRNWIASLRPFQLPAATRDRAAPPVLKPLWTRAANPGGVKRVRAVDLDGDGRLEILAASGNSAVALEAATGKVLWQFPLAGPCADVAAGEAVSASPGKEVLVAGGDSYAYLLSARGKLLSKHQIRGPVWNQNYGDRPHACTGGIIADLDHDGAAELVLGTQSMELRLYTPDWKTLAVTRRAVLHGSIDFLPLDLDRDGRDELVATDHYGRVSIFGADGGRLAGFYTSIGDMQAAVADLDGDGRYELAAGSSTGDMACWRLPAARPLRSTEKLWRFDNFGYGVNRLRAADLGEDGRTELLVASQTGYLYALDGAGKVVWQQRVGTDVIECLVLPGKRIFALDRSGAGCVLGGSGRVVRRFKLGMLAGSAVLAGDRVIVAGPERIGAYRLQP